jgi:hypothetical protein
MTPKKPVAELARLQRLAEPTGKNEEELTGGEQRVGVLLSPIDESAGRCEPPQHRSLPPQVLAEAPDHPVGLRADPGHREREIPKAERMVCHEDGASGW